MGFQIVEIDGASFTGDGRLKVAQEPPAPPPATTPVDIGGIATVGGTPADTTHVITSGKTLVVQNFNGGAAPEGKGSKVELFDDPNGNGRHDLSGVMPTASFSSISARSSGQETEHAAYVCAARTWRGTREIAAFRVRAELK
jgi:hypothetical protein